MTSQNIEWDKSKGATLKIVCQHCDGETNHKVLSSVNADWHYEEDNAFFMDGLDRFEIIICLGCDTVSFKKSSCNSEDTPDPDGNVPETETIYPSHIAGRKQIDNVYLLPDSIENIYKETHGAICSKFNILAGIGIRALVESVCKEKNAVGNDLEKRINDLVLKGILTKDEAGILHKTRLLGNRSAHEVAEPTYEELEIAMDIVENLLRNVYIIPERAKKLKIGVAHGYQKRPPVGGGFI